MYVRSRGKPNFDFERGRPREMSLIKPGLVGRDPYQKPVMEEWTGVLLNSIRERICIKL